MMCLDGTPARPGNEANTINELDQNKIPFHSIFGNPRFLRASDRERHFLAYFFSAGGKEVSRQKGETAQLRISYSAYISIPIKLLGFTDFRRKTNDEGLKTIS